MRKVRRRRGVSSDRPPSQLDLPTVPANPTRVRRAFELEGSDYIWRERSDVDDGMIATYTFSVNSVPSSEVSTGKGNWESATSDFTNGTCNI